MVAELGVVPGPARLQIHKLGLVVPAPVKPCGHGLRCGPLAEHLEGAGLGALDHEGEEEREQDHPEENWHCVEDPSEQVVKHGSSC